MTSCSLYILCFCYPSFHAMQWRQCQRCTIAIILWTNSDSNLSSSTGRFWLVGASDKWQLLKRTTCSCLLSDSKRLTDTHRRATCGRACGSSSTMYKVYAGVQNRLSVQRCDRRSMKHVDFRTRVHVDLACHWLDHIPPNSNHWRVSNHPSQRSLWHPSPSPPQRTPTQRKTYSRPSAVRKKHFF